VCLEVAVCASGEWYCTAAILGEQLRVIVPERMQLWWQEGLDGYLCEFCALDSFVSPFFFSYTRSKDVDSGNKLLIFIFCMFDGEM
jgi:hypothetical protein